MKFLTTSAFTAFRTWVSTVNPLCYTPVRNVKIYDKIKWVRPQKLRSYGPESKLDLVEFTLPDDNLLGVQFANCKLLENASEEVRKLFTLGNLTLRQKYLHYRNELVNKVKLHEYDFTSTEVKLAHTTALLRFEYYLLEQKRTKKKHRSIVNELIHKRMALLRKLRRTNYKKFEWILDQLQIKFVPIPIVQEKITRKVGTKLLADLKMAKLKEAKLAQYKEELDKQKIPFLEKKLEKLKWIQEQESAMQLKPTVLNEDIEKCVKDLERVTFEVSERQKTGYLRKVHPYTLELYTPETEQK